MPLLNRTVAAMLGAPHVAGAISTVALIVSAVSLYYTRQSELRQLEQLIVTEGDQFSIADAPSLEVSKDFEIANISDRVISVQELNLETRLPRSDWPKRGRSSIELDGKELLRLDELNLVIKPGEILKVVVKIVPNIGPRAAEFLLKHPAGSTPERLTALCRQGSIDVYDNPLSQAQRENCPSFRAYRGKHNLNFVLSGSIRGEIFMLVVRTHRDSVFSSDRYQLEIGNSVL